MNCVARGTGGLSSRAAYMIPFGLFYIVPTFVASCIWFVPEVSHPFLESTGDSAQWRAKSAPLVTALAHPQGPP